LTVNLGITYILTWIASPDACVKCQALNGKTREVLDLDTVPDSLEIVSHPNCRCTVDVEIQVNPSELIVW